jgi:hypothetical protein
MKGGKQMTTRCARCERKIECRPTPGKGHYANGGSECWCGKLPGQRVANFGGCLCEACLRQFENYALRLDRIERTLVRHFEDVGYEPDEEYDTTWHVECAGCDFNLTEMAAEINEAIGAPMVKSTARD